MNKNESIIKAYKLLRDKGIVHTQKEFAKYIGYSEATVSKAIKGDERFLTDVLVDRMQELLEKSEETPVITRDASLPVIPTDAIAGSLGEFALSISDYDCERMVSPIKGADFAIRVCGESMSPEYPNGSTILIKKVNEKAFVEWGKVYVLDTDNGVVIKQVRKTDKEGVVECISINPDFQPFTLDTSFINGWYRVMMCMSFK